jgi:NitT/TauT family transport system substrate-binding protein
MKKKALGIILALAVILTGLTGAGFAEEDHGTLYVSFMTGNIRIAVNILAQQLGYFREEGVTVQEVNLGGMDALTAINGEGNLDVLGTGFVPDLQAIGNGYDLVVIGGTAVEGGAIIAKEGNAERFRDEGTVISIDGVLNAKLGFKRNEAAWVITRQYLLDHGAAAEQIEAIEDEEKGSVLYYADDTAVAQAVQKGEIDLGFLPLEYALLYADAYGLETVTAAGALQENYVCCREVTSKARLEANPEAFKAYEKARIRAFEYYKAGETDEEIRKNVIDIVTRWSGKEADYVETYLYGGVTKYAVDPNTTGIIKYVEAANNSGLLSSAGIDFAAYDIRRNIDTSVFSGAISELVEEHPENEFYRQVQAEFTQAN